jgi:hypothetical protein
VSAGQPMVGCMTTQWAMGKWAMGGERKRVPPRSPWRVVGCCMYCNVGTYLANAVVARAEAWRDDPCAELLLLPLVRVL